MPKPLANKLKFYVMSYGLDVIRIVLVANFLYRIDFDLIAGLQDFPNQFYTPLFIFKVFPEFPLSPEFIKLGLILSLLLLLIGFLIPVSAGCAVIFAGFVVGWKYNFHFFHWSDAIILIGLCIYMVAPWGGRLSLDKLLGRFKLHLPQTTQIFALKFVSIYPFFSAGISKLRHGGWAWPAPENMQEIFRFNVWLFPSWIDQAEAYNFLLNHPVLLSFFGAMILILELLSPLAFFARCYVVIVPLLVISLASFAVVFGHNFLGYYWPLYLIWVYSHFNKLTSKNLS